MHEWKLSKLRQYFTVFPSHFYNIFLKSFRLLQNFMRNCKNSQTRFHKTNDISWNFSGVTQGFHQVLKYFVNFQFHFRYFQKMTPKFWFCSYRFEILKFWTWRWQKFKKSISQLPTGYVSKIHYRVKPRNGICNILFSSQLMHGPLKVKCYITLDQKGLERTKHSNLLDHS
jgi:hypothetical protein